jgi:hypothetical protein
MKKPYHVKVLLAEMEKRKEINNRYSLRAFAKFLGIAPSTLSRVLTTGQELSVAGTRKIMKKLQLNDQERLLFIASVAEEKKLRTLTSLGKVPGEVTKDFKFTLESIASLAMKQFSDGCIIHLTNSRNESILHAKQKTGHFEGGNLNIMNAPVICHPILSPDSPLFINLKGKHDEILEHLHANSLLCIPVMKGDKKCGAITFLRSKTREDFCENDLDSAKEFSQKTSYVYDLLTEM